MPISPNSLTTTAYFLPCCSVRMRLERRLAGAEIASKHGHGDLIHVSLFLWITIMRASF